jgi:hypothetical protein
MKRRDVLGAVAGVCPLLAAGCLGADRDGDTTATTATTSTRTATETATTAETTTETYESPAASEFAFAARVLGESPKDSPPRIGVELTNETDHSIVVSDGALLPFTNFHSTDGALALVPDDREYVFPVNGDRLIPASRDDCWTLGANIAVNDIGLQKALDPGASATTKFSILASSSDPCLEAGTYRFENTVSVRDGRADPGSTPSSHLGLSFTVERTADGGITEASGTI